MCGLPTFCVTTTESTPGSNRGKPVVGGWMWKFISALSRSDSKRSRVRTPQRSVKPIGDADRKLKRRNADCAIAICYQDGLSSQEEIAESRIIWTIRNPANLIPAASARWSDADLSELASIIKLAPMQLGDPDLAGGGPFLPASTGLLAG